MTTADVTLVEVLGKLYVESIIQHGGTLFILFQLQQSKGSLTKW